MNAGKAQSCFIDSNIWLYRFIVNPNDPHAIPKQKIATSVTNYHYLIICSQIKDISVYLSRKDSLVVHTFCSTKELLRGFGFIAVLALITRGLSRSDTDGH